MLCMYTISLRGCALAAAEVADAAGDFVIGVEAGIKVGDKAGVKAAKKADAAAVKVATFFYLCQ
jgi:hypothetical protein